MPGPQTDFFESRAKHPGFFGGRGAGKTVVNIIKTFAYVYTYPGAIGCYTVPAYHNIDEYIEPVLDEFFGRVRGVVKEPQCWELKVGTHKLVFPNLNSTVFLRPGAEPEKVRGMTLAFFAMDEIAQEWQHKTFINLQGCLRQKGYPHQGWVVSTPDRQRAWIKRRWVEKVEPITGQPLPAEDYPLFPARTKDNVYLPAGYLENLIASMGGEQSALARQELFGEFIVVEGAGFSDFGAEHIKSPPLDTVWRRIVVGMDFGATNPTALVEVGLDENNTAWVIREFYKRNCRDDEWVEAVGAWGAKRVICDPSVSEKQLSTYRQVYGVPMWRARDKRFDTRWQRVSSRLHLQGGRPGLFVSPACPNLISELQNLAFAKPRGQDFTTDEWEQGCADHAYDALAYALMEFEGHYGPPPRLKVVSSGW